ncbi:MAG: hypothetical protein OXC80_12140 [Gammaproteobacteria bacterium]|nr:hypothetical protein [Gammaproteobacteria bacterium]
MKEGRPSDLDELSDSLMLLEELVHRLVDSSVLAANRTLEIAQKIQIDIPYSQEDLNKEEDQMRESLRRFSDFLEGVPHIPRPYDPGQSSSGEITWKVRRI